MRKLLRSIAKENMRRAGLPHVCRKHNDIGVKVDSFFSRYWKEFVNLDNTTPKQKKRKARKAFA